MTHPSNDWTPGTWLMPATGGDGPSGMAEFASWGEGDWSDWQNAKIGEMLDKYGVPFEYLSTLASNIVLALQGNPGPLEDQIEDAVRDIPIVGDMIADLWDAIRGEYEGDDAILQAISDFLSGKWLDLENVPIIGDLIEVITGQEDGDLDDLGTWINQLKTILSGGTVGSGLMPTLSNALSSAVDTVEDFVQSLVNAILQAIRGIPVVGGTLADIIADIGGLNDTANTAQSTAVEAATTAQQVTTQVNYVRQVIAVQSGMGVWETGPDRTGTPSFAFGMLALHSHTVSASHTLDVNVLSGSSSHSHNLTGSTGNTTAGGTSHSHTLSSGTVSNGGSHTHTANLTGDIAVTVDGMVTQTVNATAAWAPWGTVIFKTAAERKVITFLAMKSGTVSSFYLDVYKLLGDGSSELLYSSADLSGDLSTTLGWMQHLMASQTIVADIGDSYEVQFRMTGSGTVSIAGVNFPYPTPISGMRPYASGAGRNPSTTAAPATISPATRDSMYQGPCPFVSLGIDVGQTTVPRYIFDDFSRSSLGASWSTKGNIGISSQQVRHTGSVLESSTAATVNAQQLVSDTVALEFDVDAEDGEVGVGLCCTNGLTAGAWARVTSSAAAFYSGAYNSLTVRGSTGSGGDGHYIATYTLSDNTFRLYRGSVDTTPIATWLDSSNIVGHGAGKRWVALTATRNYLTPSGKLDNFTAADVA